MASELALLVFMRELLSEKFPRRRRLRSGIVMWILSMIS